jgi:hypothetical protein
MKDDGAGEGLRRGICTGTKAIARRVFKEICFDNKFTNIC